MATSDPLIHELKTVLLRAKFDRKIASSLRSVEQLVQLYLEQAIVVKPSTVPRLVSDPDDDVVIGTALAAKADIIVTGDHALLTVSEYEGIRIVSASDALRLLSPSR